MRILVRYFAQLRDERGLPAEEVETGAACALDLYHELRARHGFTLDGGSLLAAVNGRFASWDQPLRDGDHVVFLPPVGGG